MVKDGDKIAVWFSCGAPSAVAAKKTLELYGNRCEVFIINNPVAEEHPDNARFLLDVQGWLCHPIHRAINQKYLSCSTMEVWDDKKYMSGVHGAPCTRELKKEARYQWEELNKPDWHVLGFTLEEKRRSDWFKKGERENTLPILIDAGITREDCFRIILEANIELPEMYKLGYPNANCIGCVKATSPTYWNHVRKVHPEVFKQRAEQSRQLGCKLVRVKGKRLFLDELPEDAIGQPMKSLKSMGCGIFCDEWIQQVI